MEDVKDLNGHLVCKVNKLTGYIEAAYKKQATSTNLPIGGAFKIERFGAVTVVTRDTATSIKVERYKTISQMTQR